MTPIFNCLFWFLATVSPENQYKNYNLPDLATMAKNIIRFSLFKQICGIKTNPSGDVLFDDANGQLSKTIYDQLVSLMRS